MEGNGDDKTVICTECDRRRFTTGAVKCSQCGQGNVHCSRMFSDVPPADRLCESCLAERGVHVECRRTKKGLRRQPSNRTPKKE